MWQLFSERARKSIYYAQQAALQLGEGYVSTEHLLLGIIREPATAACRILEELGVSPDRVRGDLEVQLPKGDVRDSDRLTMTPRVKRVIDLTRQEALELKHDTIGTEHLLLGLARESDGLAGRILGKLGVDYVRCLEATIRITSDSEYTTEDALKTASGPKEEPFAWSAYRDETQQAILRAHELATSMGESQLTPFQLIFALLEAEQSEAAQALKRIGLEPSRLRAQIEQQRVWADGAPAIQLSPNGRHALDMATAEAHRLGANELGSVHLLLGLLRGNPDGVGRTLAPLGLSLEALRNALKTEDA